MLGKGRQPPVIYLHQAGVARAVSIFTHGFRIHVGLNLCDGAQKAEVNVMERSSFRNARVNLDLAVGERLPAHQREDYEKYSNHFSHPACTVKKVNAVT